MYPPHTPTMKNSNLSEGGKNQRPPGPVRVEKKPMTKQPLMLTRTVPQGKLSPHRYATSPENQKRATLPSAPPSAIQR